MNRRGGIEIKATTVEIDRQLEPLLIAEAALQVLDPLDPGVQSLGYRVRDPMDGVCEDVLEVPTAVCLGISAHDTLKMRKLQRDGLPVHRRARTT
jgi:hypothetical protein